MISSPFRANLLHSFKMLRKNISDDNNWAAWARLRFLYCSLADSLILKEAKVKRCGRSPASGSFPNKKKEFGQRENPNWVCEDGRRSIACKYRAHGSMNSQWEEPAIRNEASQSSAIHPNIGSFPLDGRSSFISLRFTKPLNSFASATCCLSSSPLLYLFDADADAVLSGASASHLPDLRSGCFGSQLVRPIAC